MNNRLDWNDLNYIRAIAEGGSLSGAARLLRVSHATVFRRLGEIESQLGVRLFERSRTGYAPTAAGEEAAAAAARIAEEVFGIERRLAGRDLRPSGTVRVTTTDTLFFGLLSPVFEAFRVDYPDIALEVALSNDRFDLSRREADIAIRPATDPPDHLTGRRIGRIAQAAYVARARYPADVAPDTVPWIGPDARMGYPALDRWMTGQGFAAHCAYRLDSMLAIAAAVRDGAGAGILPCYLADRDPAYRGLLPPVPELEIDLWILIHSDLRGIARMKAFTDHVANAVKAASPRLAGNPG